MPRGTWDARPESPAPFAYRAFTFCGSPFQAPSTSTQAFFDSPAGPQPRPARSRNPAAITPVSCHMTAVWARPFSLAATGGVALAFLSSGY